MTVDSVPSFSSLSGFTWTVAAFDSPWVIRIKDRLFALSAASRPPGILVRVLLRETASPLKCEFHFRLAADPGRGVAKRGVVLDGGCPGWSGEIDASPGLPFDVKAQVLVSEVAKFELRANGPVHVPQADFYPVELRVKAERYDPDKDTFFSARPFAESPDAAEGKHGLRHDYRADKHPPGPREPEPQRYSGLLNEGATCYMNSFLQALYHLPIFRRMVYGMDPTSDRADADNVPLNLQSLFARMQGERRPCSTRGLTRSFGWRENEHFIQHDVQEFSRVLLENLSGKFGQREIERLFEGRTQTVIRVPEIGFESRLPSESFRDLSLIVTGCSNLMESFLQYTAVQELTGGDQYDCGEAGKRDAHMSVEILELPPVLHLHLQRFAFDSVSGRFSKIHSFLSFPTDLDLSEFVSAQELQLYRLFGVLVHSGSDCGGHYLAFLKPEPESEWFEFNDSYVHSVSQARAIDDNFGSLDTERPRSSSAYMLVYVRVSDIPTLYEPVPDTLIPERATAYLASIPETREPPFANASRVYRIVTDEIIHSADDSVQGFQQLSGHRIEAPLNTKCSAFYTTVAAQLGMGDDPFLIYGLGYFPALLVSDTDEQTMQSYDRFHTFYLLPAETREAHTLIFVFFFDPGRQKPIEYHRSFLIMQGGLEGIVEEFQADRGVGEVAIFRRTCSDMIEKIALTDKIDAGTQIFLQAADAEPFDIFVERLHNERTSTAKYGLTEVSFNFLPSQTVAEIRSMLAAQLEIADPENHAVYGDQRIEHFDPVRKMALFEGIKTFWIIPIAPEFTAPPIHVFVGFSTDGFTCGPLNGHFVAAGTTAAELLRVLAQLPVTDVDDSAEFRVLQLHRNKVTKVLAADEPVVENPMRVERVPVDQREAQRFVGVAIKAESVELSFIFPIRDGERVRELRARIWDAVQGKIDRAEFDSFEGRLRPKGMRTQPVYGDLIFSDRLPGDGTLTLRVPRKSRNRQLVIRN
jgi:ubiquitin C-terminal hydrolase